LDVLVTGGTGFIGSNLVRCLVASGDRVRVLDNLSTGTSENLQEVSGMAELIVGDVRDAEAVRRALDGIEVVFHLAAFSGGDPVTTHQVNVGGTLNVLVAASSASVRRVVYASSSSVYGSASPGPLHEEMPVDPLTPGGVSKLAGEAYCRAFTRVHGLETVSLRFFDVFGPRQATGAVVPRLATRMLAGLRPVIYGDGRQSRDFVFVANTVQALLLAADAGSQAVGQIINIGGGRGISILELVSMANELLGTSIQPIFAESRLDDNVYPVAAISRARGLLGYRPLVSIRQGLSSTLMWFAGRKPRPRRVRVREERATMAQPAW
jgi:UDP-glucose 4-epimerase